MTLKALVPMVFVTDVKRSVDFYSRALGFRMTGSYMPDGRLCWACLKSGDADLMLSLPEGTVGGGCIYYYYTDDVVGLHAALARKGIETTQPFVTFYGMKEITLRDPDGNVITVGQNTDEPPTDGAERAVDLREHK
ncbi:MAG: hypothetical protein BIFFINMI_03000 [Phycisphaerae bacterium]|nr:hypothetical protein [Phycisphaerae bacterium]